MRSHALLKFCCKNHHYHHHHHHHHHHHICLNSFFCQKPVNKARSLRAVYTLLLKKIQNTSTIILALNFCTHFKIFIIWRARQMPVLAYTREYASKNWGLCMCTDTLFLNGFPLPSNLFVLICLGKCCFCNICLWCTYDTNQTFSKRYFLGSPYLKVASDAAFFGFFIDDISACCFDIPAKLQFLISSYIFRLCNASH